MDIHKISTNRYRWALVWAILVSILVVAFAAGLGRAALNLKAAITDKPDIAIYLLLPEENIGRTTVLREERFERDYMAETKDGLKFIKLRKADDRWYVAEIDALREEK